MPRVIHFEIPADDPNRAVKFYTDVFGWKIQKWEGMDYWLCETGKAPEPGIDGAIMPREPVKVLVNTIGVPSVDDFIKKVEAAGGKIIAPKMPIPGVGWFAYCIDTEGNLFGIMESDEKAK